MKGRPRQDVDVAARMAALDTAMTYGGDLLDPTAVRRAQATIQRTKQRLLLGAEHTVVGLAGATGSGKSSLFNALAGMEIAEVGVRRPTTSQPTACVWGGGSADLLLDWLGIAPERRIRRESVLDADRQAPLHGLVLLDLPDHDSTEAAHRAEVDRLVQLVDLLIWVVDPQKYADDALHSGYLQRLIGHDGVMIVVLNQVDRLEPEEADTCRRDLRRLLDGDGLDQVGVLAVSAVRGDGVDELRDRLAGAVQHQTAVVERAAADLQAVADDLAQGLAASEPGGGRAPGADELVRSLAAAVGVPAVVESVRAEYRRRGALRTGWPVLRWLGKLTPDVVGRLGIDIADADLKMLGSSMMPTAAASQRPRVRLAVDRFLSGVAGQLPARWGQAVQDCVATPGDDLVVAVDNAVGRVDLGLSPPAWWRAVGITQYLLSLVAVAGAASLFTIGAVQLAGRLPPDVPAALGIPVPVLLFVGGLVGGGLLAVLTAWLLSIGARRRRDAVSGRLHAAVHGIADSRVIGRVQVVLDRHRATREALAAMDAPVQAPPPTAPPPASEPVGETPVSTARQNARRTSEAGSAPATAGAGTSPAGVQLS